MIETGGAKADLIFGIAVPVHLIFNQIKDSTAIVSPKN